MNRQIKFRVWDTHHKQWVGGCAIELDGTIIDIHHAEPETNCIAQQYTGLLDKNGKEIFEGDILNQLLDSKPCYYIVEWGNQADYCGFVLRPIMKRDGTSRTTVHDFQIYLAKGFEIIGNIFEMSELLKKP